MEKVSVIIPNYNHAKYLKERIESVLNQTYENFDVLILDDCSTDNSREIIESYRTNSKVSRILYNDVNSGSTFKQWNKGVSLIKGEWVWIAESDDVADPNFLYVLMTEAENNKDTNIIYCQSHKLNSQGLVTGSWVDWTSDLDNSLFLKNFQMGGLEFIEKFLIFKNIIPNASAVIFKRKCFQEVGGADEEEKNCADWFLWLNILLKHKIKYVALHLNYFRYHDNSVIAKAWKERNDGGKYFQLYDRRMRVKLHALLIGLKAEGAKLTRVIKVNTRYIGLDKSSEGLFLIRNNNHRGWPLILKGSVMLKSVVYLKSALKYTFLKSIGLN